MLGGEEGIAFLLVLYFLTLVDFLGVARGHVALRSYSRAKLQSLFYANSIHLGWSSRVGVLVELPVAVV